MSKILAIDCSIGSGSAAVLIEDQIQEQFTLAEKQQAPRLLPMIDSLLANNHIKLTQLDALAFACGPGNFTAIRMAASIIQSLSFSANLPVICVSTLQTLAQTAYREQKAKNILTAVDAFMGEIYWAAYKLNDQNIMEALIFDSLCKPEDIIIPKQNHFSCVGTAWQSYQSILTEKIKTISIDVLSGIYPHAQDVAVIAKQFFLAGKFVTAEQALPVYLRGEEAWKKMEAQAKK